LLQSFGIPGGAALAMIDAEVTRQAVFIAYLDDFKVMMIVTFAALPMLLLMRRARRPGEAPAHAVMD
jgi:DHA2 family multidrug resistance protein